MEMIFGTPLIGPSRDDDETENEMQQVNVFPPTQFGPVMEEIQRSCNMTNDDDALSLGEVNNTGNVPTKLTNPLAHLLGGYDTDTDSRAHNDKEDASLPNEEPTRDGKNSTILCSGDDAAPSTNNDDNQNQNNATIDDEKSRSSPGAHNANEDEEDTQLTKNEEQSNLDRKNSTMILCNIGGSPSNSDGDQSQKKKNAQLYVRLFEHATQCTNTSNCKSTNCAKMKSYLTHWNTCTIKVEEGSICATCKRIENLLRMCNTRIANSMLRMSCGNNSTLSSRPAISSEAVNNLGISAIMNKCLRNDIIMTLTKQSISIADNNRRRHLAAATTIASSAYDNDSDSDDDDDDDDDDSDEEIGQWVYQMAKSKNKDMLSVSSERSTVAAISASSSTLSGTKRALEEEEEEVCSSNNDNVPTPQVGINTLVEVYLARDNETPRTIAKKLKLNCTNLVRANKKLYPTLRPSSKLMEDTSIQISHLDIIVNKEDSRRRKIIATSSS